MLGFVFSVNPNLIESLRTCVSTAIPTIIPKIIPFDWGHAVSVAGINPKEGKIALSDPMFDKDNPLPNPEKEYYTLHNNASIVSHDRYIVNFSSPYPLLASWWLPDYPVRDGALIYGAIIISEIN